MVDMNEAPQYLLVGLSEVDFACQLHGGHECLLAGSTVPAGWAQ